MGNPAADFAVLVMLGLLAMAGIKYTFKLRGRLW